MPEESIIVNLYVEDKQWCAQTGDSKTGFKGTGWTPGAALCMLAENPQFRLIAERMQPKIPPKEFIVFRISENTNAFGLHGHWLMARDGECWEVARYRGPGMDNWEFGSLVSVKPHPMIRGDWDWSELGCEIPEKKPSAPTAVVGQVFKLYLKDKPK